MHPDVSLDVGVAVASGSRRPRGNRHVVELDAGIWTVI